MGSQIFIFLSFYVLINACFAHIVLHVRVVAPCQMSFYSIWDFYGYKQYSKIQKLLLVVV